MNNQSLNYTHYNLLEFSRARSIVIIVLIYTHLIDCYFSEMSRGRSERKGNEVDFFGRRDPFQEMHQVMRSFGGIGGDDFFGGSLMRPFGDPFQEMMEFSNGHKNLHKAGKQGTYVSQTFVSSSTMGPDGKIKKQSYFQNNAGQNKNGQTISQKHQAYKNNDGIKRIAEERMLNDKGHKIMKEKRGEEVEQTNHYYNIDEGEAERFQQDWRSANNQMKFLENVNRGMKGISNNNYNEPQRQLGYEPRREQPRRNQPKIEYRPSGNQGISNASQKGSSYKGSSRGNHF